MSTTIRASDQTDRFWDSFDEGYRCLANDPAEWESVQVERRGEGPSLVDRSTAGDVSGALARPWGLRGLKAAPTCISAIAATYDPLRQVAVTPLGEPWVAGSSPRVHSSIAELDGDEGRTEQWGDDDGKDVTESW